MKRALADAKQHLAEKMKSLEPQRAAWEKQLLAAYEAGDLAWRVQRPLTAKSDHGAVLTIYNDEDVDYTTYEGGTLAGKRAPGNGVIIVTGPNPDNETYTVTLQPGAGKWKQLGLEVVMDENLPGLRVARGADRLLITELEVEAGGTQDSVRLPAWPISTIRRRNTCRRAPSMAIRRPDGPINAYNETTKAYLALRFAQPLETSANTAVDGPHPPRFRNTPRHHGPLPAGAFAKRILVADGRKRQGDSGRRYCAPFA